MTFKLGGPPLGLRDVRRELHDFVGFPIAVGDRVVAGLKPDLTAVLCQALELGGAMLALRQSRPEFPIFGTVLFVAIDEHGVMTAFDFRKRVSHHIEEILVRGQNRAVRFEFDHGLRFAQRPQFGFGFFLGFSTFGERKHRHLRTAPLPPTAEPGGLLLKFLRISEKERNRPNGLEAQGGDTFLHSPPNGLKITYPTMQSPRQPVSFVKKLYRTEKYPTNSVNYVDRLGDSIAMRRHRPLSAPPRNRIVYRLGPLGATRLLVSSPVI